MPSLVGSEMCIRDSYKELGLKDKLLEMSEEEQLKLLSTDGMLVKRPLVVGEKTVLTGFSEKTWTEQLLGKNSLG